MHVGGSIGSEFDRFHAGSKFNNVASGNYFAKVLERLNIAETVKAKVARVDPPVVFERILKGTGTDMGVGTIPQIIATKGLRLVGPLPAELQSHIVYAAAPPGDDEVGGIAVQPKDDLATRWIGLNIQRHLNFR